MIRRLLASILLLLAAAVPRGADAQDYTWTVTLLGGVGGSLDEGGGADVGGQVAAALQLERLQSVWVRGGQLGFDTGGDAGSLADAEVTYLDFGGEYQFHEGYYESGLFLGLGAYRLEGTELGLGGVPRDVVDDTVLGLVLGASGEFKFSPRFAFLVEISGHVLDSDAAGVLGMGHAGFALHF
ncbi:MAG: hypothetical protein ACRD0X_01905 [Thermoanaerobaculia bacterium]